MNYPDSAQAVASSQFNKHFLGPHYQQCSRWAMVTAPARGREEIQSSTDPGCTAAVLGYRCLPGVGDSGRSPKGAIPSLLAKAGIPPFLIMCTLCPQAFAWISLCLAPLPAPSLVLPWLFLSAEHPRPHQPSWFLASVQIILMISPLSK